MDMDQTIARFYIHFLKNIVANMIKKILWGFPIPWLKEFLNHTDVKRKEANAWQNGFQF